MKKKRIALPKALSASNAEIMTEHEQFRREAYPKLERMRVQLAGGRKASSKLRAKSKAARKARRQARS